MREDVVLLGQTPPPWHGQAVMIDALLRGATPRLEKHHVPLAFSRTDVDIGRVGLRKVVHLGEVIARARQVQRTTGARVLYYPPAGPALVPLLRDLAILGATRKRFERVVFHFHAAGLGEFVARLPAPLRALAHALYGHADRAIVLSPLASRDGEVLGARETRVVPYGIEDVAPAWGTERERVRSGPGRVPRVLYVGSLRESKGVLVLVEAARRLAQRGCPFELDLVGAFASRAFEGALRARLDELDVPGLRQRVTLWGSLSGDAKWRRYAAADVFCFPSFYEAEALPVVLLEALQFGLPIVATRWRGIPSIVDDQQSGTLVEPRDVAGVADGLERLLGDQALRARRGQAARRAYLERFTLGRYLAAMEDALAFN